MLTFTLRSSVTVLSSAGPIMLVVVTMLRNPFFRVKHNGAPFLLVSPLRNFVVMETLTWPALTSPWPFVRYCVPLTAFVTFRFGTTLQLEILWNVVEYVLVPPITVLVSGRSDTPLREKVSRKSLAHVRAPLFVAPLLVLSVTMLAIIGPFRAIALAPLRIIALTSRATLNVLVDPTKTFPVVFCLAFITTVAGAVNLRVYG